MDRLDESSLLFGYKNVHLQLIFMNGEMRLIARI